MSKSAIKVLSLLNGQELVGLVETVSESNMHIIHNPLVIMPQQGPTPDQMGFGFMPWPIFGVNESYNIDFSHVVIAYEPRKEVLDGYNNMAQKISASKKGLVLPAKPRLIIEG